MRVLFVTSEAHPLIKTGGLADVSGALPAALAKIDVDVRILIPAYKEVLAKLVNARPLTTIDHLPGVGTVSILLGEMPDSGTPVMAIVCPTLYERAGGPYQDTTGQDWLDNPLRFGVLSKVAAILSDENSPVSDWVPDITHCNDWQCGLTPAYMYFEKQSNLALKQAKSIISLHNMAFQGTCSTDWVPQLGLPMTGYSINGFEYYGQLSFLKAGIFYADFLSTVSPTYAKEIQTVTFGFGMQGLLTSRKNNLLGILNGIDTDEWNPETDSYLAKNYSDSKIIGKKAVKKALQTQLGLTIDASAPLLGIVSRLTYQKGLDLFLPIAGSLLKQGCQLALLGSGDSELEIGFQKLVALYPAQVAVTIGYNEALSHQIMSGSDIFIMPSRFEPCGLNQFYGLRYGTPPIVANTGGLADSVTDTNDASVKNCTANGYVMPITDAKTLRITIERALKDFKDAKKWRKIQKNGMNLDLSWKHSAMAYLNAYEAMINE